MDETIVIRTIYRNEKYNCTISNRMTYPPLVQTREDYTVATPVITHQTHLPRLLLVGTDYSLFLDS